MAIARQDWVLGRRREVNRTLTEYPRETLTMQCSVELKKARGIWDKQSPT